MSVHPDPVTAGRSFSGVAELFQAHADWLRRTIRRRFGDQVSPEDVVQEAYLRAPPAAEVNHPRAFLLQVASRIAIDHLRHERRAARLVDARAPDVGLPPDQAEILLLKQVLDALPPTCRQTFLLSRFSNLTYEEIARRQGVSVKTVEWRISKALAFCAARLDV